MLTMQLFQYAIDSTEKVTRYKADDDFGVFGGKARSTKPYPFPPEMMREFINAFELIDDSKKEASYQEWKKTCKSLLDFFKKNSIEASPVELKNAVLRAMIAVLERHPGSLLHELIALHQVRNTINFDKNDKLGAAKDIRDRMKNREVEVHRKLSETHALLDHAKLTDVTRHYLERALGIISEHANQGRDLPVSIEVCKLGLLIAKCYHLSKDSYNGDGLFISELHDKANYRFLLELDKVHKMDTQRSVQFSSPQKSPEHLHDHLHLVDLTEVSAVKFHQPKKLSESWIQFFIKISEHPSNDLVTSMTHIFTLNLNVVSLSLFPIRPVTGKGLSLQVSPAKLAFPWFIVLQEHRSKVQEYDNLNKNYGTLYDYLKIHNPQLLSNALEPIRAAADNVISPSSIEKPSSMTQEQFDALSPMISPAAAKTFAQEEEALKNKQAKLELQGKFGLPNIPMSALKEEQTPVPDKTNAESDQDTVTVGMNLFPDDASELQATEVVQGLTAAALEQHEKQHPSEKRAAWEEHYAVSHNNINNRDNTDANEESVFGENDDLVSIAPTDLGPQEVVETSFPQDFFDKLKESVTTTEENSHTQAMRELIDMTLTLFGKAEVLLEIKAPNALKLLQEIQKNASSSITIEEVYGSLYTLFQAIVLATCKKSPKGISVARARSLARSFSLDASVVLLKLENIPADYLLKITDAHLTMLQAKCSEGRSLLQILTHHTVDERGISTFDWSSAYENDDNIEQRRYYEAVCVFVLRRLLNNSPHNKPSIEEQWLIMKVFMDYKSSNQKSPFYNALIRLASTGPSYQTAILISDNAINDRANVYLNQITSKNPHATSILPNFPEQGSPQEILEKERKEMILSGRKTVNRDGNANNFETGSQGSVDTTRTGASGRTYYSNGSSWGASRTTSSVLLQKLQRQTEAYRRSSQMIDDNWGILHEKYCVSNDAQEIASPMDEDAMLLVINNFENKYREETHDKVEDRKSVPLLRKVFEQLQPVAVVNSIVSSGPTVFSQSASTQEATPSEFAFVAKFSPIEKEKSFVFEQYCIYLAERGQLKSYETQFILDNLRYLDTYKVELQEFSGLTIGATLVKMLELVYPEWNRQLKVLEAEGKALIKNNTLLTESVLNTFKDNVHAQRERRKCGKDTYIDVTSAPLESNKSLLERIDTLQRMVNSLEKKLKELQSSSVASLKA